MGMHAQEDTMVETLGTSKALQMGSSLEAGEETHRGFKSRHSQMIALGGAIGTSLFLGTAQVLRVGGPAFLVASYGIMSILVYGIVTGIAEVATHLPVPGGTMSYYGNKYASSSLGFAMGYLYWYSLGILVPYELVAVNLLIDYWNSPISPAVWITVLMIIITLLNFLPVRMFGEAEFWSAGMKILLILMLIFLSIVLFFGGGPNHDFLEFRYWRNPGPINAHVVDGSAGYLVAFLQSTVLASFAFVLAPEQLIVTGGEMQSPRHNLPRAARRYFWRLVILFMPCVLGVGIVCAYDNPLLNASGAASSPFVIAIKEAGIPVLDSVVNALIMLSAATAGNAFLYQSSRNLYSLAVSGNAPKIFKRCNKHGLPYFAVAASSLFSLLAYLSLSSTSLTVFNWLINITNTAGFISWICCGIIYTRFRKAVAVHEVELSYQPKVQPWGIMLGTAGSACLLLLNGFTVFLPGQWSVGTFLTAYIGIVVFAAIYGVHRACHWSEAWIRKPESINMYEGLEEVLAAERPPPNRGKVARLLFCLIE